MPGLTFPPCYIPVVCGFAGLIDPMRRIGSLADAVAPMRDALAHRGPDDARLWADESLGVCLGFRRLRVVDLSDAASQPMTSASGRYTIVLNGEIYNFQELRQELGLRDAPWRGSGDVEVFLAAIERWGLDEALRRSVGMFAFALVDRAERVISLVRDRLGVKPLVWCRLGGGAIGFASELAALRRAPGFDAALDDTAVMSFMRFGCIPAPQTIHASTRKVLPGQIVSISLNTADLTERIWWSPLDALRRDTDLTSFDEAVEVLHATLRDAARVRLHADVPLGGWLSSGVDSAAICALAQSAGQRPLRTFSASIDDPEYDESARAEQIAKHLGTTHTPLRITASDALALAESLPVRLDEPFGDSSVVPTFLLAQATRQHVTVALSGDGGDELFGGYERHHWYARLSRYCGWMPAGLRRAIAASLSALRVPPFSTAARAVLPLIPGARRSGVLTDRVVLLQALLREREWSRVPLLLAHTCLDPAELVEGRASDLFSAPNLPPLRAAMLADVLFGLPNDLLVKVDWASMQHGLEVRSPLLDHRVYELSCRMSRSVLAHGGAMKAPLRAVLGRLVPPELVAPRKMGFGVPLARWLRGDLREWLEDSLSPKALAGTPLRSDAVRALLARHQSGSTDAHATLWNAAVLARWLKSVPRG